MKHIVGHFHDLKGSLFFYHIDFIVIVIHPFQLILDLPLSQIILLIFSDLISNLRISWFSRCWLLLVYVYDITYHIFHKLYQLYSWIYYIMYRWRFACATKYFRWWQHYDAKSFDFYGYFIFTKNLENCFVFETKIDKFLELESVSLKELQNYVWFVFYNKKYL